MKAVLKRCVSLRTNKVSHCCLPGVPIRALVSLTSCICPTQPRLCHRLAGYVAAASCEQLGLSLDEFEVCFYLLP